MLKKDAVKMARNRLAHGYYRPNSTSFEAYVYCPRCRKPVYFHGKAADFMSEATIAKRLHTRLTSHLMENHK